MIETWALSRLIIVLDECFQNNMDLFNIFPKKLCPIPLIEKLGHETHNLIDNSEVYQLPKTWASSALKYRSSYLFCRRIRPEKIQFGPILVFYNFWGWSLILIWADWCFKNNNAEFKIFPKLRPKGHLIPLKLIDSPQFNNLPKTWACGTLKARPS